MPRHTAALGAAIVAAMTLAPLPAAADLERITNRDAFVTVIQAGQLRRVGINLTVTPDGSISGRGFGYNVTGQWTWQDGYFCRSLAAGDWDLGYNCQQVSVDGETVRFQSDRGTGDFADFRVR